MYSDHPNIVDKITKPEKAGRVVWITGLSGAGKSVLAAALVSRLRMIDDEILLLDGDDLRKVFGVTSVNVHNYGRDKRMELFGRVFIPLTDSKCQRRPCAWPVVDAVGIEQLLK